MIAVFAILKIYPFGSDTIMTGDTTYQLVDYLSYYKTILFGDNDFSYSMSKTMGGEMSGFAAYYLYSPLNLLTLPFPKEYLFAGIGLIIILTPGLASLSMCYTLRHLYSRPKVNAVSKSFAAVYAVPVNSCLRQSLTGTSIKQDEGLSLILSLCYGLSAYVIVYNELLYYYTNLILLPLIYLRLRRLTDSRKLIDPAYILLLTASIINNYYTGYMICLFLLIYMIYYLAGFYEGSGRIMTFMRFSVNSLISAGLSAAILIPAVLSLSGEKDNFALGLYLSFPPLDYFSKLYSGSFSGDFGAGMPNIYCGVIVSLLLVFILLNKSLGLKQRLFILLLLLFFWGDFCVNTANVVWHGLNHPIGFPYRQAFVVIFYCIVTVYEYTDAGLTPDWKTAAGILGVFILYSLYVVIKRIDNTGIEAVIFTAFILILLLIVFYFPAKHRLLLLGLITVADLSFNAGYSLSHFYPTSVAEYQEPLALIGDASDHAKELQDKSFYRTEKLFRRTNNDAMMFDYAGLTHFSSSEKKATMNFMGELGFRNNGNWAMYTGVNTALADSVLGVRYVMSQFDGTGKPYDMIYADPRGDYYIYENTHAIPVMSAVSGDVFYISLTDDPFSNQNAIAGAMSGDMEDILLPQDFVRHDNPDGSVSFDVDIKDEGILYCFFTAPDLQDVTLYLDGDEWTDYFRTYDWATIDIKERKPGDTAHVELVSEKGEQVLVDEGYFAVIDDADFIRWSDEIREDKTVLYKKTSSYYEGTYDTDREALLFSVPCDKGWHLYIDGREYELKEACGHMTGASVPAGKHEVVLRFIPPGSTTGYIISGITCLMLVIYCVFFRLKPQYFDQKIKSQKS